MIIDKKCMFHKTYVKHNKNTVLLLLTALGTVLGRSWPLLGRSWAALGPLLAALEPLLAALEPLLGRS